MIMVEEYKVSMEIQTFKKADKFLFNMASDFIKSNADIFSLLGSPERLSILLVLHGSLYVEHEHKGLEESNELNECLSFSEIGIATNINSSTRLSHHLSRLLEGGLIDKIPFKDTKGRVFALYGVTEKWIKFAEEMGVGNAMKKYLKSKYPTSYIEAE